MYFGAWLSNFSSGQILRHLKAGQGPTRKEQQLQNHCEIESLIDDALTPKNFHS
jgi:hypothetical protein